MKTFRRLRMLRAFEKRHLPFLETIEDLDVIREIGFHQEIGQPLTLKLLFLQDIGSVATVQRRLRRLKRLGVVNQRRADRDKRNVELTISPRVRETYRRMGSLLARA